MREIIARIDGDAQIEYDCDVYLTNILATVEFIITFHIRRIVVGADLQKRNVGYVHNFEVVFPIVVNDRGVVGLLFGSGVIGRLKSARDELLERREEEERANLHIMEIQC